MTHIINQIKSKIEDEFYTNNVDTTVSDTVYEGSENSSGKWMVKKINLLTLEMGYASLKNNPTMTTYADAWTDHTSLTYSTYATAL
jgi:hypothetical protein